ncbi:MAG: hypothetical protein RIQ78_259, partial [Bacteroidota bacterium]
YFHQCESCLLPTRERIYFLLKVFHSETEQGFLYFGFERPSGLVVQLGDGILEFLDEFRVGEGMFVALEHPNQGVGRVEYGRQHIQFRMEFWLLVEPADADVFSQDNFGAFAFRAFFARDDPHEGCFAGAILGNQANFLPLVYVEADILEQDLFAVAFGDVFEGKKVHREEFAEY